MGTKRLFRLRTAHIIGATAWWCVIALGRNGFNVLIELITEKETRQRWRKRNAVALN